jgi:CelD/BcsL family acetyltransferase involved in cellulose biosynthesis
MQATVAEDLESLAPHIGAWDALAVQNGRPFCAPAWMLSWWREARSADARLRVVLVFDQDELAGVGPFFAQVGRLRLVEIRLLAAGFCHRIGPLAAPGREHLVAGAMAQALAEMSPRPASVVFEGIDRADPWPELIAARWPSRRAPRLRSDLAMQAPAIELGAAYERWLDRRERKFRKEARRTQRRMQEHGIEGRVSADEAAIDELLRLHHARWDGRGGSNVGEDARRVIVAAARAFGDGDRLKVALLEGQDGAVAAELVLQAGGVAAFWGGGFDPAWASFAPGTQAVLLALRHLAEQGAQLADLGGGAHQYKQRLADADRPLLWQTLFPRGWRYPLIRARLAPKHARLRLREAARRHAALRWEPHRLTRRRSA